MSFGCWFWSVFFGFWFLVVGFGWFCFCLFWSLFFCFWLLFCFLILVVVFVKRNMLMLFVVCFALVYFVGCL